MKLHLRFADSNESRQFRDGLLYDVLVARLAINSIVSAHFDSLPFPRNFPYWR